MTSELVDFSLNIEEAKIFDKGAPLKNSLRLEGKKWQAINATAGDCHVSFIFIVYSDGHATFEAVTWTDFTHSKDVFNIWITVLDTQGVPVFGFGPWDSPPMDSPPAGGYYNWSKVGYFPPDLYAKTASATFGGRC